MSEAMDEAFDKHFGQKPENPKDLRTNDQRVASLEEDARQPRLAIEADGPADTKTRERTEGASKAVQAKHGDSCTAQRVQDGPKISTCFGVKAELPAPPCEDDVVVENGTAAPKSRLSPLEMRTTTAAGDLLPTGKTSTTTKTTFDHPTLWLCLTEETNLGTSTQSVSYDSRFLWKISLPNLRVDLTPAASVVLSGKGALIFELGMIVSFTTTRSFVLVTCLVKTVSPQR